MELLTQRIEAVEKESIAKDPAEDESLGLAPDTIWFQTNKKMVVEDDRLEWLQEDLSDLNHKTEE